MIQFFLKIVHKLVWEMRQCVENICGKVSKMIYSNEDLYIIYFEVGDGVRYYMRGCAIRGRVSRKQGRDCIERVGMYFE
jgi:hypothetical protein